MDVPFPRRRGFNQNGGGECYRTGDRNGARQPMSFVDASARSRWLRRIVFNAKTQRPPSVMPLKPYWCNWEVAPEFLPLCGAELKTAGAEIRGCEVTRKYLPWAKAATAEDWVTEYLDLILAVKVVSDTEEALAHIRRYGTRHSEGIVTWITRQARIFTIS